MKSKREGNGMNSQKSNLSDVAYIALKALKVSFQTKGTISFAVSVIGFFAAVLPTLISIVLGEFTNQLQGVYTKHIPESKAITLLLIMILLYICQSIYLELRNYYNECDNIAVNKFIEKTVIDCAASVEYKYIENEGDFHKQLSFMELYGAERVAGSINQVINFIQHTISFVSLAFAMSMFGYELILVLLLSTIPSVLLANAQNDETYKNQTKSMYEAAMSVHLYYVATGAEEHCRVLNTVRFTGAFPWIKKKWRDVSDAFLNKKRKLAQKHLHWNIVADCLRNGIYVLILLIVSYKIYRNPSLGLGSFIMVYQLSGQLQSAVSNMLLSGATFMGDIPYMKDFFSLSQIPKEQTGSLSLEFNDTDIVCNNVTFCYPSTCDKALNNISVTIKQGEKIAIVGVNGSGKSTFVNLLCGMYSPTKGSVKVGGFEVYKNLEIIRKKISIVFQNFGRYETSIRKNIIIGDNENNMKDEDIYDIAYKTGAMEVIQKQPNGLSEIVGTFSSSGNNLSGGQWQKIALTRALYRKDSKIVILDEPTASLDPLAEAKLYQDFLDLTGDKTTILISHRLGIATVVDRILVFDKGEIVEDGKHRELLNKGGVYAKLYRAQAKWYQ